MAIGRDFSVEERAVWLKYLGDIPDEALTKAIRRAGCECKGFPTVALVRGFAAEASAGVVDTQGDTFARVSEAVRRFGPCLPCVPKCDRCREDLARKHIGEVGWVAVRAMGGWSSVCNTETDQMGTLRAQYREAYRAAAERETHLRSLPESLKPRINNASSRGLPEPSVPLPELRALPQPTEAEIERAKLSIFREPTEAKSVVDGEEFERRRQQQLEAAAELARRAAQ